MTSRSETAGQTGAAGPSALLRLVVWGAGRRVRRPDPGGDRQRRLLRSLRGRHVPLAAGRQPARRADRLVVDPDVRVVAGAPGGRHAAGVRHRVAGRAVHLSGRRPDDAEHHPDPHLPADDQLPAVGDPAVHLHGLDAGAGGADRRDVRRDLQVAGRPARRPRGSDGHRVDGAGGDGRRDRRGGRDHGHHCPAGHAEAQVRSPDRARLHHGGRHAGHPDPAVDPGDHLCGRGAGVGGRALYRLADPRSDALRSLHRLRLAARADQPGSRPVAAAGGAGGLGARSCGCCARCWRRSS